MNYSGISECDVLNGTGFRTVLFVSGCDHKCHGCHNPETWNKNFGHPFTEKIKEYILECLSKDYIDGITITGGDPLNENNLDGVLDLITTIREKYPIFEKSDSENPYKSMVLEVENPDKTRLFSDKTIWLYSGYEWTQIMNPIITDDLKSTINADKRKRIVSKCDVLIDGRYIDSQRDITLKWRGSKNQRVIDVQESLKQNKIILHCE